jgi:hypothetical protein
MRAVGLVVGAGALLAAGAIGVAVARSRTEGPRTPDDSTQSTGTSTGITWANDALLPDVRSGGAAQAQWAAAAIGNLDADGDRRLQATDGSQLPGAWGPAGPSHVVDALIARYDTSGDGVLDGAEAALVGADVAVDGWLSQDAVRRLRAELGG